MANDTATPTPGTNAGSNGLEPEKVKLHLAFWNHCMSSSFSCCLCGQWHEQNNTAAGLFQSAEHTGANALGDVCPDCLAAGAKGAAARMRGHANELRKQADEVESNAAEIAVIQHWPSFAEFEHFAETYERRMIAEMNCDPS